MGLLDSFQGKLVQHGLLGELGIELDVIRSEYPRGGLGEGHVSVGTGASASAQSMSMAIPSGMAFHLRTLIIDNQAEKRTMYFFDGPGVSVPMFAVSPEQSTTEIIGGDLLKGIIFLSEPFMSTTASLFVVRMGGLIRERTAD